MLKYHPLSFLQEETRLFVEKISGLPPEARAKASRLLSEFMRNELIAGKPLASFNHLAKCYHKRNLLLARLHDLCNAWAN